MKYSKYAFITVLLCVFSIGGAQDDREIKQHPELSKLVKNWAEKLGRELWLFGQMVTRKRDVEESLKDTIVETETGEKILQDIHEKLNNTMEQKVLAVERIMDVAEHTQQSFTFSNTTQLSFFDMKNMSNSLEKNEKNTSSLKNYTQEAPTIRELRAGSRTFVADYGYNRKYSPMLNPEEPDGYQQDQDSPETSLEKVPEMEVEVTNQSAQDPQASQKQIDKTSMPLYKNKHFYNIPVNTNYSAVHVPINVYEKSEPVLSGIIWSEQLDETFKNNYKEDPTLSWQYFGSSTGFMRQYPAMIWHHDENNPDLFDCRTRTWFIEAASSPKDILILVDRSGSMKGMRREIARHVVYNILDTLGNNDYVNIYTFSNSTDPLVQCFNNTLIQANLNNVRVLKEEMDSFATENIADFEKALRTAFELLQDYRFNRTKGAKCNQAIMLITDGSQYNFMEIFKEYNWREEKFRPVRVFTYLVGQEVSTTDTREVRWMACANHGYYTHLKTYAEVREEVLHYIPVMARPMVLNSTFKPNPAWSPVYADVTDPKLTNWLWEKRLRNKQKDRYMIYRNYSHLLTTEQIDKKFVRQQKYKEDDPMETQIYRLMTSVSLPVYDRNPTKENVANLLGVAGTDVPIEYIRTLMDPFRLGVNGYAFLVTNNGYVLTHPDLRPVFEGILKPAYNRVDMMEVEILDDNSEPRQFSDEMRDFRLNIIHQFNGKKMFGVKCHLDNLKRLMIMNRLYFYTGIERTPFTLVVALPQKYGLNRVQHHINNDIHRMRSLDSHQFLKYFNGNWSIHPDWHYCKYYHDVENFETAEEEFIHFLKKINGTSWAWTKRDSYFCDRKLVADIVADAKITSWFSQNITITSKTKEDNGAELIKNLGIVVAFMATHSGFTRWQNFPQNINDSVHLQHFHRIHNRAIDETWYRRAVDYHYVEEDSFVYSVPHDVGQSQNTLVTVSNAIFVKPNERQQDKKAPAAVVGYQFYHSALTRLFEQITHSCADVAKECPKTCESEELLCVMLDDNGYVIVSEVAEHTGYHFGQIRPDIMNALLEEGIYTVHRMYDYQALCTPVENVDSAGLQISTPLMIVTSVFEWAVATLVFFAEVLAGNHVPHHMRYHPNGLLYTEPDEVVQPIQPIITSDDSETIDEDGLVDEMEESEDDDEHYVDAANEKSFYERAREPKTKLESCDKEFFVWKLVHYTEKNISNSGYNKSMDCFNRPFIVQSVTWSNMIFLVINEPCTQGKHSPKFGPDQVIKFDPEPVEYKYEEVYNMSLHCYLNENEPPRKLYFSCINRHEKEHEITMCGRGTNMKRINTLLTIVLSVFCLLKILYTS